jgi:hypothetical protein
VLFIARFRQKIGQTEMGQARIEDQLSPSSNAHVRTDRTPS